MFEFRLAQGRNESNGVSPALRLDGFDMGHEFMMVCLVVNEVLSKIHVESFMRLHHGHHPLYLNVKAATETFDNF